jgi:signal transduction histidine kinase
MLASERDLRATLDRQNKELQEANNSRKQFLSSVSHELKTPLTIIAGFVDLLSSEEDNMSEEERTETLDIIRRNANHLDVLINDILDISRLDAGTFKILPGAFNASLLIRDIESSFHSVLAKKRQSLAVEAPAEDIWLIADRTRISQVITNMVSNASKYSPEDTGIELTCEVDGERLHVAVRDHGIGIPEEQRESLFTPFFRVDNETTRKVSGTGLGLVIAKSIVEMHSGEIRLESEQGMGTKIEFWLPDLTTEEEALAGVDEKPAFTGSRLWRDDELDEFELGAD